MKVLLDTNIVLDVLLERELFVDLARDIFILVENAEVDGYLCVTSVTTLHYLIAKALTKHDADETAKELLTLFCIAEVNKDILQYACTINGIDYEDSVIYVAAKYAEVDMIVTRDKKGFKQSEINAVSPQEFLALMKQTIDE